MVIIPLFNLMAEKNASDMFFTVGAPIQIKINGTVMPINDQRLSQEQIHHICHELMTPEQAKEFAEIHEMNFARRGAPGPSGAPVGN